jgi:carboxypeptidase family protein
MRASAIRMPLLVGVALLMTLLPRTAGAQSTIAGVVTDTTGAVLPGVTVEAESPALIEKVRTATTNADGRYSIVDIRPGVYMVSFTLPGFSALRREGIEVAANVNVPVNAELKVGSVADQILKHDRRPYAGRQEKGASCKTLHCA